jgi:hypothetical protein
MQRCAEGFNSANRGLMSDRPIFLGYSQALIQTPPSQFSTFISKFIIHDSLP